jgi:tetratricopeptide (TPR) repeat protein
MQKLSPTYRQVKQLRSTGRCGPALALLRSQLPVSDDDAFEAVVCLLVCGDLESALGLCRSRRWKKEWASQIAGALSESLRSAEASGAAVALARKAAASGDAPRDVAAVYLLILQNSGLLDEANAYITSHLQEVPADEVFLSTIVAEISAAVGNWRQGYRAASAVLAADPDDYRALIALSQVNDGIGNVHEALGNAIRASVLRRASLPAILQLMRCHNKLGNHYSALGACDMLSQQSAAVPEIQVEVGRAYQGLGDRRRAVSAYRAALHANPGAIDAIRALIAVYAIDGEAAELQSLLQRDRETIEKDYTCITLLGLAALNAGVLEEAARYFRISFRLTDELDDPFRRLPWPVPEPRLRHDYEQLQLLDWRGRLDADGRKILAVLARYCGSATTPHVTFAPEGGEAEELKNALSTTVYVPEVPFSGPALGDNAYPEIEESYLKDGVVIIDNFVAPEALQELRQFCEEATIWKLNYERGYLGALLAQGFAPRVLLAIAYELKKAMPRVIGDHPLTQAWAYKYDQRLQGINMHADFAEVNVNFWITPDEACQDPSTGGMVIYDVPVPRNWTFYEYNNESEKLGVYVKVHSANARRVPYCANRCVLFDSSLIHVTDEMHFKGGYENRRVNVTLLYGKARSVE